MLKWLEGEVGARLHTTLNLLIIVAGLLLCVFFWPIRHGVPVLPGTVSATPAASQTAKELNAAQKALQALAAQTGPAPLYQQPAITVLREVAPGITRGLTDAQIGQIITGLKKPTAPVYRVATVVVPPSPVPSPGPTASPYDVAYAADVAALQNTRIDTHVTIDQVEVPPSRVGTIIGSTGAGISYSVVRRGRFDLDLGVVTNASHLSPVLGVVYMIPHTSIGLGPILGYNQGVKYGAGLVIKF